MLQRCLAGWPQKVEDQLAAVQVIHGVAKNKQIATNNHLHQINFSTFASRRYGTILSADFVNKTDKLFTTLLRPLLHKIQQLVGAGVTIP